MSADEFDAIRAALDRLGVHYPGGAVGRGPDPMHVPNVPPVRKWIDFTIKPEFVLSAVIAASICFWTIGSGVLSQREEIHDMQNKMQQTLDAVKNLQEQVSINRKDSDKAFPLIDALTRQMDLANQSSQNLNESMRLFRDATQKDSQNTNQAMQKLFELIGNQQVDIAVMKSQSQSPASSPHERPHS